MVELFACPSSKPSLGPTFSGLREGEFPFNNRANMRRGNILLSTLPPCQVVSDLAAFRRYLELTLDLYARLALILLQIQICEFLGEPLETLHALNYRLLHSVTSSMVWTTYWNSLKLRRRSSKIIRFWVLASTLAGQS
jgi:hypothetical protein